MSAPFDLERFVSAQDEVWPYVTAELTAGHKRSHWMWFVFPQISGLGLSATALKYAIPDAAAAKAYLDHPTLGSRLDETTRLVLEHGTKSADEIFGAVDAMKFRSSLTLFEAADGLAVFADALAVFYDGVRDHKTLGILAEKDRHY